MIENLLDLIKRKFYLNQYIKWTSPS